jgi:hypothetical protein
VLDDDAVTFLESPASLVVGMTLAGGVPYACHAWGLRVTSAERGLVRVVLGQRDARRLTEAAGAPVAVTAAAVATLQGLQAKGHVVAAEPPTAADLALFERHRDQFFAEVERIDGEPVALLARMVPPELTVWVVRLEQLFDQTPGPGAGAAIESAP